MYWTGMYLTKTYTGVHCTKNFSASWHRNYAKCPLRLWSQTWKNWFRIWLRRLLEEWWGRIKWVRKLFRNCSNLHEVPNASVNSNRQHPAGQPLGFCTYFQPGSQDLCHLNCLGVARVAGWGLPRGQTYHLLLYSKYQVVSWCHMKACFSFKLICHLLLLSCYKLYFKAGGKL